MVYKWRSFWFHPDAWSWLRVENRNHHSCKHIEWCRNYVCYIVMLEYVTFELLRTVTMKFSVFWGVMPCSLVERINISEEPPVCIFQCLLWRRVQHVTPKHRQVPNKLEQSRPSKHILHAYASYAIIHLSKFDVALKPFSNNITVHAV